MSAALRGAAITVCVSTRNRAGMLEGLFTALSKQDIDVAFDVSITDNDSTDDTFAVAQRLAESMPFPVHVQRNDRGGGPAVGRNLAASATDAAVLAFTDDDCRPEPGWLRAGYEAMRNGPAVVVGSVVAPEGTGPPHPLGRAVFNDHWRFFVTANVFYRRDDFVAAGGFDEGFVGVGGEDTDLGLRVCKAGAEPRFEPDAVVVHPVRQPSLRVTLQEAERWHTIPRLVRKHPEQRRWLLHRRVFWRPSHQWMLLALVSLAFGARRNRWVLLGVLPWLWHRLWQAPTRRERRRNLRYAPVHAAVDILEIAALVRGSVRERSITL